MATRKSGIGQFGLERFKQGLEDVGVKRGKYEEAFESAVQDINRPYSEDEGPSSLSVEELCARLGLNYTLCFGKYQPAMSLENGESTRVRAMQFIPDGDLRETLTSILDQTKDLSERPQPHQPAIEGGTPRLRDNYMNFNSDAYEAIIGGVVVEWVNRPSGNWHWEYYDVPLREYLRFRTATSPGAYLNRNTMPIHGPYVA